MQTEHTRPNALMKLAIMQPYLFPYVGYFQLVASVDRFLFYDDVNFIKRGWINRNRLLLAGEPRYFTVPLSGASQNEKIHSTRISEDATWRRKLFEAVRHSYGRAPFFDAAYGLLEDTLSIEDPHIATVASRSVTAIASYLGLETQFDLTSRQPLDARLKGADRILNICQREQATEYYNLPGGRDLYAPEAFEAAGISLRFIEPNLAPYPQFGGAFHPGLSMLDVLMFNDPVSAVRLLKPSDT